jgi:tetratricopeptide (TPR) repeat protein
VIGERLGPYEILEEIGKGGMATVYRARQTSVDRDVAIKVIQRNLAHTFSAVQRFQREAKLIARLEHPHILPIYDFDGAHEPPYIVMRYLDGGTLRDVMSKGTLPHSEIVFVLRQVCAALDYAHRQGIIHRDIKPSNILIDREGNAFVNDLGIARLLENDPLGGDLTETNMVMGTPEYMSPQQAMDDPDLDHRTDIYALGVMLFEMLTGRLPYRAASNMKVVSMHIMNPIPSAREINGMLPELVDEVIRTAMAKEPRDRYATAIEFGQAAAAALGVSIAESSTWRPGVTALSIIRRLGGKPETTTPQAVEQNKLVTVLYANAAEYAEIVEDSGGVEAARQAMQTLWLTLERVILDRGGEVFARTDSDLLALWGAGAAHEEDAENAIRAALGMQAGLREVGAEYLAADDLLPLNIGIHSGMALIGPGNTSGTSTASGATISLANRLMQNAQGSILISHEVFRQVLGVFNCAPDEPLRVRGRAERIACYQVISAKPRAFRTQPRGIEGIDTQMIGRQAEFEQVQKAFLSAVEDGETRVVTVVSEAGIGKSRLLYEFDQWADLRPEQYYIFYGRAVAGTRQRPYGLIRDIIAFRFQIRDDDAPAVVLSKLEAGVAELTGPNVEMAHLIGHLGGFDVADSPVVKPLLGDPQGLNARTRSEFVRLFTALAKAGPSVMLLEDIHHADDASLDLLNDLFQADSNLHLLVVATARPELYTQRPGWGSGQRYHTRLDLKPLDKRDSRDLARELLQRVAEVPKTLRDLLVDRAEGNPRYLEELVKMLLDDHVIVKESDGQWRVEESRLGALSVPATLHGLLQARLDTLLYPEKLTLQRAAVFGRIFYDKVLVAMDVVDEAHVADLPEVLTKLTAREFILRRETSAYAGSTEYIFSQAMLRDAIYDRLLQRQLKVYHAAAGDWLAGLERASEHLPLIAEHYEHAGDLKRAADYLQRAGDALLQRGHYREAVDQYQRALKLVDESSEEAKGDPKGRLGLLVKLGEAANGQGDLSAATGILADAERLAERQGDTKMLAVIRYQQSLTETARGNYPAALALLDEALPLARQADDGATLAKALYGLATTHFRTGNHVAARAAGEECLALAKMLGDQALQMLAHNRLGTVLSWIDRIIGLGHYHSALNLARQIGHRDGEQMVLSNLGFDAGQNSNWDEAIRYSEEGLQLAREDRNLFAITISALNLASYYLQAERLDQARAMLRESLLAARQMGSDTGLIGAVQSAAEIRLYEGDVEGGLRLFGLARHHPASAADLLEDQARVLEHWQGKLGLSAAQIEAGLEAGRGLDLAAVVAELLEQQAAPKP